jgi:hypothetical protein
MSEVRTSDTILYYNFMETCSLWLLSCVRNLQHFVKPKARYLVCKSLHLVRALVPVWEEAVWDKGHSGREGEERRPNVPAGNWIPGVQLTVNPFTEITRFVRERDRQLKFGLNQIWVLTESDGRINITTMMLRGLVTESMKDLYSLWLHRSLLRCWSLQIRRGCRSDKLC